MSQRILIGAAVLAVALTSTTTATPTYLFDEETGDALQIACLPGFGTTCEHYRKFCQSLPKGQPCIVPMRAMEEADELQYACAPGPSFAACEEKRTGHCNAFIKAGKPCYVLMAAPKAPVATLDEAEEMELQMWCGDDEACWKRQRAHCQPGKPCITNRSMTFEEDELFDLLFDEAY